MLFRSYHIPAHPGEFDWIRVSLQARTEQPEWSDGLMAGCIVRFLNQGEIVKDRTIRPQRILTPGWPRSLHFDIHAPRQPFDSMMIEFRNPGETHVLVDNVQVQAFDE